MSTFYTHEEKNTWKTFFLMLVFIGMIVGIGWFLSYQFQDSSILYIAIGASVLMNFWAYWFSHKTVVRITGAKEASIQQYSELHNLVENLAITAGLPKPKVYVIEDQSPNAFATGRDKHHAIIAVSTGLLQDLNRVELEGVIAHELAHIGNNDMLLSTTAVVFVGVLTMIADLFIYSGSSRSEGNNQGAGIIGMLVIVILMPIIGTLLRMAISRKREFLADASAVRLTRYPDGLASALQKISDSSYQLRQAPESAAHLFISDPKRKTSKASMLKKLFSTHPPIEKRITALRSMGGTV